MTRRSLVLTLGSPALAALLAAGCAIAPPDAAPPPSPAHASPAHASPAPQPSSRVFDSQHQRDLATIRAARVERPDEPWYTGRRDLEPTVVVGERQPTFERSVTITTDRQRIIRGRAFDHHRTTIYRREFRTGVR